MIETLVNVNMGVNQLKTGSSKSISKKNAVAQIPSTVLLQQVSCNRHVSKIQVHLKNKKKLNVCLRGT